MKRFIFLLLFTSVAVVALNVQASDICVSQRLIKYGSIGEDVVCLQKKLGLVADGQFGPKTLENVKFFQLSQNLKVDGVVGLATISKLNEVKYTGNYPAGCSSTVGYSTTTGVPCYVVKVLPDGCSSSSGYSKLTGVNCESNDSSSQNEKNDDTVAEKGDNISDTDTKDPKVLQAEKMAEAIKEINKKNGYSEEELQFMGDTLKNAILESDIDYNKQFEELLKKEAEQSKKTSILYSARDLVSNIGSFLGIKPKASNAVGLPFGGAIVGAFLCPFSANWLIMITPLPPTYPIILSYFPGTQGFASYNIPFTLYLLGLYEPFGGVCVLPAPPPVFILTMPTEGVITPMVGSSPLPL